VFLSFEDSAGVVFIFLVTLGLVCHLYVYVIENIQVLALVCFAPIPSTTF
jgi:hypothetical protein